MLPSWVFIPAIISNRYCSGTEHQSEKENIVNFQSFSTRAVSALAIVVAASATFTFAQTKPRPLPVASPMAPYVGLEPVKREMAVAERNNLYCAGYVQNGPIDTGRKIVGSVNEEDGFLYGGNNVVYLNVGASSGVQVGDTMSIVRPRGHVKTRWTSKGKLGFYVQEVGAVEVIRVNRDVSVARLKTTCDSIMLGDLVQPSQV